MQFVEFWLSILLKKNETIVYKIYLVEILNGPKILFLTIKIYF